MSSKFNNKGFSLIELMVVVAIIGILAAVGIPQYAKFQAKARTGEAKASLAALFVTEKSFLTEFSTYSVDAKNLGFAVEGSNLRYVTGFAAGAACSNYVTSSGAPAEVTTRTNSPATSSTGAAWHSSVGVTAGTNAAVAMLAAATTACDGSGGTFTAAAVGDPRNTPATIATATADTWTINNAKLLKNTQTLN